MLLQPDFPQNPFTLITSKKNQQFAECLQDHGADNAKLATILKKFYSFNAVLGALFKTAKNPEWANTLDWVRSIDKQYKKAIVSLEILFKDDSIPSDTRETIIKKDVKKLKATHNFFIRSFMPKPLMKPAPQSANQMLVFQSFAVFQYLKQYKGEATDKELYDFMAELFRNLYKNTALESGMKTLTGDLMKKNLIDNADKLRGKYKELEKAVKPFL